MPKEVVSDRVKNIEESATLALNAKVKQMAASGKTVYNLTAGELACDTPDYIKQFVSTKLDQNKYTPAPGLDELREKIAAHCRQFYGLEWIKPANVIATGGVKPALWAVFESILNPGDEIILPTPAWVSYVHLIKLTGAKIVTTKLNNNFDLDVDDIRAKISPKTKAILLNSPHNPTGAIFSSGRLRELARIANKKDIVVISDDIYSKLVYSGNFAPVAKHGFKKLVIASGFSKSQALTGWRIGYLIADEPIAKACNKLLSHATGNAPVLAQYAAIRALEKNDRPVDMAHLKSNRELACSRLDWIKNLSYVRPSGAFYIFLNVSKMDSNSLNWCEKLLQKKGVALVPGEAFSAPGYARMSFVGDKKTITKALDLIADFCKENS